MKDKRIIEDNQTIEKQKKSIEDTAKQITSKNNLFGAKHLIWD
jgi:hypothetical protein